ncbi:MAG: ATP-binding cassette domain-containing protein [Nocardioides sp.]
MSEPSTGTSVVEVPVVGVREVTKKYSGVRALDGVTADFGVGVSVLLGRNGAGKSTLCRVLSGVERPDTGELRRRDQPLADRELIRGHLRLTGWLPQSFAAQHSMTVTQFVRYAGWLKDLAGRELEISVERALEQADLVELRNRRLGHLSGGMLRRLGIAQAIVHQPDLLILDEPTVGLDPEQRHGFHSLILALGRQHAVVLSTHLLEDVVATAHRVTVLDRGTVRFTGTRAELVALGAGGDDTERIRAGFLGVLSAGKSG